MKVTKESLDIYTRKVTVEMSEAEWLAIRGFAAAAPLATVDERAAAAAAGRLAGKSDYYWNLDLDWSRLFTSVDEK